MKNDDEETMKARVRALFYECHGKEVANLKRRAVRAEAREIALVDVLRSVEWGSDCVENGRRCPSCQALALPTQESLAKYYPCGPYVWTGDHAAGCALFAALKPEGGAR